MANGWRCPGSPFRSSERGRYRGRENWIITWLHDDSLGSSSIATNASGAKISELRYSPFGEVRYAWNQTATDKRFTGYTPFGHAPWPLNHPAPQRPLEQPLTGRSPRRATFEGVFSTTTADKVISGKSARFAT